MFPIVMMSAGCLRMLPRSHQNSVYVPGARTGGALSVLRLAATSRPSFPPGEIFSTEGLFAPFRGAAVV